MTPDARKRLREAVEKLSDKERIELARSLGLGARVSVFAELAAKSERGEPWTLGDHARAILFIVRERIRGPR